ncbi:uncharacterized protein LOC100740074 isoform X1 [Bombus impatiens]|uniref:Uncharacterized protein LOC100740074 isoform X1 n=1 Tax=Bombus impatiens TaxID=132113 RepID=A0A6P3V561_BOMIM|nr:uncharacterized protein LOC100740074 isoform X1 [Bombus impatiens]XP_012248524.1 uncharacterized protein LOC100740074 isoform X1 [Bombus impatiens]XP_012248525.1 uncharacterized protein LOC100740074 isoform X1 [Bombus impatiens]
MWMILASGLLAVALANSDNAASVAPEAGSKEAVLPPEVGSNFEEKLPTTEQLLGMLDSMTGLSDEEKSKLREDLLKTIQESDDSPQLGSQPMPGNDLTMQTMVLLSLLSVVALIFVFFVYKLFKCLSERESKREEKKKNKQMKKKK